MEKRFIYGSLAKWNANLQANEAQYANSIVFIISNEDSKKGIKIYTQGAYFDTELTSEEVELIVKNYVVGSEYIDVTEVDGNLAISLNEAFTTAYATKQYVDNAVANKNVTAEGDTYVEASAEGNKVIVKASDSTKASLALADSALQKADITTGSANGTIAVEGTDVAVKGLGSAAYETKEHFEEYADNAASTVKTELLGDATEAGNTLGKLEDRIETIVTDTKTYSIAKVEGELGENVKEAFKLVDEDGTQVGETINIYKDSSLISIALVDADEDGNAGQFLKYTYVLASGVEETIYVDANKFLVQSEFKNGLQVNDAGEVSVKVDTTTESYLTVSENGIKVSGIDAIKATADSALQTVSASGSDYVTASFADKTGENGAKTQALTVSLTTGSVSNNDNALAIASDVKSYVDTKSAAAKTTVEAATGAEYLTITPSTDENGASVYTVNVSGINNAISSAVNALDSELTAPANKVYTKIVITDGKLDTEASVAENISEAKLVGYTNEVVVGSDITAEDSINSAIAKLETTIDWGTF